MRKSAFIVIAVLLFVCQVSPIFAAQWPAFADSNKYSWWGSESFIELTVVEYHGEKANFRFLAKNPVEGNIEENISARIDENGQIRFEGQTSAVDIFKKPISPKRFSVLLQLQNDGRVINTIITYYSNGWFWVWGGTNGIDLRINSQE